MNCLKKTFICQLSYDMKEQKDQVWLFVASSERAKHSSSHTHWKSLN